MGKVIDITDKLSFDENPCLLIKGKKLEVNADAPTMLKLIGIMKADGSGVEMEDLNEAYELILPEKSRKTINEMKLNFKDWSTVIESAIELIMGDDEPGEQ